MSTSCFCSDCNALLPQDWLFAGTTLKIPQCRHQPQASTTMQYVQTALGTSVHCTLYSGGLQTFSPQLWLQQAVCTASTASSRLLAAAGSWQDHDSPTGCAAALLLSACLSPFDTPLIGQKFHILLFSQRGYLRDEDAKVYCPRARSQVILCRHFPWLSALYSVL